MEQSQLNKIKESAEEFFEKMTLPASSMEADVSSEKDEKTGETRDVVNLDVKSDEPQILIGQQGQTLFEIQRLLRNVLNKKFQGNFYVNLDINDYKRNKMDYLKYMAKESADHVAVTRVPKQLPSMSSYERRVIHAELSQRTDVTTESQGEGFDRHIVIKPK